MVKRNRTIDRRQFIATCGASLGTALMCRPWQELLADEMGRDEHKIADLEEREKEIEKILADPDIFKDKKKSVPLLNEYGKIKNKLEDLMLMWEERQDQLESAKGELEL